MELIIETLGTTHNILERHKFNGRDISIGRAFDNDLILTDEHIDAHHARIFADDDGQLWISDLKSVNGIRKLKQRQRRPRWKLQSGDIFLLGRNKIRIYLSDHKLPAAIKIRPTESFLLRLGHLPVLLSLFSIYLLSSVLAVWLQSTGDWQWSAIANSQLRTMLSFSALAIFVYLLSILFKRGGNFLSHLGVLILVFFISSLLSVIIAISYFNAASDSDEIISIFASSSKYMLIFLYLWCIFYLAFHMSLYRRTVIALAAVAVLAGINLLGQAQLHELQQTSISTDNTHLPARFLLRRPSNQHDYFDAAFKLFEQAEERRQELLDDR